MSLIVYEALKVTRSQAGHGLGVVDVASLGDILSKAFQNLAAYGCHAEILFSADTRVDTSRLDTKLSVRTIIANFGENRQKVFFLCVLYWFSANHLVLRVLVAKLNLPRKVPSLSSMPLNSATGHV